MTRSTGRSGAGDRKRTDARTPKHGLLDVVEVAYEFAGPHSDHRWAKRIIETFSKSLDRGHGVGCYFSEPSGGFEAVVGVGLPDGWEQTMAALMRSELGADLLRPPRPAIFSEKADGPVFRNAAGHPLSRDGAAYLLSKYVELAAKKLPPLRRRRISPHVLRHSCAVALLQSGVDLTVIGDYLGHSSVATTGRYIATNVEMKREALQAFWHRAGLTARSGGRWRPTQGLITFL